MQFWLGSTAFRNMSRILCIVSTRTTFVVVVVVVIVDDGGDDDDGVMEST